MLIQVIECVPNYSEGRRSKVIEAIVEPFRHRPGCILLDYRADQDHNRLLDSLAYYMQLAGFEQRQVLELALLDYLSKEKGL
jgi:glutamate formiminotransferase